MQKEITKTMYWISCISIKEIQYLHNSFYINKYLVHCIIEDPLNIYYNQKQL